MDIMLAIDEDIHDKALLMKAYDRGFSNFVWFFDRAIPVQAIIDMKKDPYGEFCWASYWQQDKCMMVLTGQQWIEDET
jgi:hypothetical protein